jgi:hypothetical protein
MNASFLPRADKDAVAAVAAALLDMAGRAGADSAALRAEAERQAERVIFARRLERRRCEEAEGPLRTTRAAAADITHATLQRACDALMQVSAAASASTDACAGGAQEVRAA